MKKYTVFSSRLVPVQLILILASCSDGKDAGKLKIAPRTHVEVLTNTKGIDTSSHFLTVYKANCDGWNLTKQEILDIPYGSQEIDGNEFHYYYSILPCYYSGKIKVNGKTASYTINAGSSTIISYGDTSVFLGYKEADFRRYFLDKPGVE